MKTFSALRPLVLPCVHDNTIAAQRAQIEQLTGQLATANTTLAAREATNATLTSELATAATNLTAMTAARDTARTELATATASLATANASLGTAQAEATRLTGLQASTESRANRLLASFGHAPLAMNEADLEPTPAPTGDSPAALQAQYRAIKGHQERAKFYAANKAKMFPKK